MNKKLFTLLTSAALMAGMAPAVFAETMDFTIKPSDEKIDGKKVYDVIVKADQGITGMQWYFKSNGDLGNNTDYSKKDNSTNGFHPDKDGVGELFADDGSLTYTPELYKKPGFEEKATAADNYQVAGAATGEETGDVSKGVKIGTLTVGEATDGDTWVDVNVKKSKATYTDPTDKSVAKYEWNVITGDEDKPADSSEAPASSAAPVVSSSEAAPVVSSSEAAPASSSEAAPASSAAAPASSAAAPASSAANGGTNNNNSAANGSNGSPDTGVASTAVVALAAASAALVVVSKKRK
jgi:hypothetical protein